MIRAPRSRAVVPVTEILVLRERMGLGRYRKTAPRDPAKRALLLELALQRIEKAERRNFVPTGVRRRRVRFD